MTLASETWRPVAIHYVHAEFLKAERDKRYAPMAMKHGIPLSLIDTPNLDDPIENATRMTLLYAARCQLLGEIPPDTTWHELECLRDAHLDELRVIGRCGWDHPAGGDQNELRAVAARKPIALRSQPSGWPCVVLWGHSPSGPFSIIEGNNRLVGYATNPVGGLAVRALVGLSPSNCYWHLADRPQQLLHMLWHATYVGRGGKI